MTASASAAAAAATLQPPGTLTPSRERGYSTAWWGMVVVIATEATIFLVLLASYFFLRASAKEWPIGGLEKPDLHLSTIFSFVLWGSSIPIFWAEAAIKRGHQTRLRVGLLVSFLMGAAFLGYTVKDFRDLHFGWTTNAYGSIFYVIVGLHALHVLAGLLFNLLVQVKAWQSKLTADRHQTMEVFSLYWHFVDVVWLFVFPSLFLSVHWT